MLYSACYGKGIAAEEAGRTDALGELVGESIAIADDSEHVPDLLAAARRAANELSLGNGPDPLPAAVRHLLQMGKTLGGSASLARDIGEWFAHVNAEDQETVARTLDEAQD